MTTINPYISFKGNCEEAFTFYKTVFGGEFQFLGRYKDSPQQIRKVEFSKEDGDKVMHVSLPINNAVVLMGCDVTEAFGQPIIVGNNISLTVEVDNKQEASRIFNSLSSGGTVKMPIGDTFWGAYFGMLVDKFGIHWMVSADSKRK